MKIFRYLVSLSFLLAVIQYMYTDILQLKMTQPIAFIVISLQGGILLSYLFFLVLFIYFTKQSNK